MKSLVTVRYKNYSTNDSLDAGEALWLAHFFPEYNYSKELKNQAAYAVESIMSFTSLIPGVFKNDYLSYET
uniref:Uncharacterized protein n=1 Tax=Panagrolaimus sp. ES5 TaxID=591445 RepID=A0AC34FXI9_9BILA